MECFIGPAIIRDLVNSKPITFWVCVVDTTSRRALRLVEITVGAIISTCSSNTAARFAGDLGCPQGAVRAHLWEAEFTYNFGQRNMFGSMVKPSAVVGAGGLTSNIRNSDTFVLNVRPIVTPFNTEFVPNDVLHSGDTFFTFSYGGGVKAMRIYGPLGFFGNFRGRTIPNFFGHSTYWPELSAGLNLSWVVR